MTPHAISCVILVMYTAGFLLSNNPHVCSQLSEADKKLHVVGDYSENDKGELFLLSLFL